MVEHEHKKKQANKSKKEKANEFRLRRAGTSRAKRNQEHHDNTKEWSKANKQGGRRSRYRY